MFQMKPKQRLCVAEQYLFYTDSDVSVHALLVVQSHISRRPRQIRYVGFSVDENAFSYYYTVLAGCQMGISSRY